MRINKNKVLFKILGSSYAAVPISFLVSFVTFKKIDPYYLGIWGVVGMIEVYANILRFGIINGMNRELPFAFGINDEALAQSYAKTTLAFTTFSIVVLWLLFPFVLIFNNFDKYYLAAIVVGISRISINYYVAYLEGTFRTSENFNILSNIRFAVLTANLLLIPLIYFWNFSGYLILQIIVVVINAFLLHKYRPLKVHPAFSKNIFLKLFKTGMPLFISSYAISFIDTIPRLFILSYGNEAQLGIYSPVIVVLSTLSLLPGSISTYIYPKLSYAYGKNRDPKEVWFKMKKIYFYSFTIIIPICLIIYFLSDFILSFFPKYEAASVYIKLSLLAGPFVTSKLGNLVNVVLKKNIGLIYYVSFYGIIQFGTIFLLYKYYISDILLAGVLSQVITSAALFCFSIFTNKKLLLQNNG